MPTSIDDLVSISAGDHHVVGLRKNGTVVQWGNAMQSPAAAQNLTGVIAVAAGGNGSFALKSDGTVVAWAVGDIPQTPPANVADVVAISSGFTGCIAVKSDGTVMQWGTITWGSLDPNAVSGVVAVSGSQDTVAALRWDGSVMTWGPYAPAVPNGLGALSQVVGVSFGAAVGLRPDGTVVAWKDPMGTDLTNVPAGRSHVVSISARQYALAIKDDGTVAAWGDNSFGKVDSTFRSTSVRAASAAIDVRRGDCLGKAAPQSRREHPTCCRIPPTSPCGRMFPLDGQPLYQTTTILVPPGSTHEISTTAMQTNPAGYYMRFSVPGLGRMAGPSHTASFRWRTQPTPRSSGHNSRSPCRPERAARSVPPPITLMRVPRCNCLRCCSGYVFASFTTSGDRFRATHSGCM
ncbi:MAG: hypothetical protein QM757_32165 [Paludibaculum sp.]